ncbi:hypothetical protein QU38_01845, partial [Staphylococcus aureus]
MDDVGDPAPLASGDDRVAAIDLETAGKGLEAHADRPGQLVAAAEKGHIIPVAPDILDIDAGAIVGGFEGADVVAGEERNRRRFARFGSRRGTGLLRSGSGGDEQRRQRQRENSLAEHGSSPFEDHG